MEIQQEVDKRCQMCMIGLSYSGGSVKQKTLMEL
jgi:hypothetical protein